MILHPVRGTVRPRLGREDGIAVRYALAFLRGFLPAIVPAIIAWLWLN